jgi:glutathione peroxidase
MNIRPWWRALATLMLAAPGATALAGPCPAWLDHDFQKLHSSATVNLCKAFAGRPLLVVNTASFCGYTPQFSGLEALHEKYGPQGLVLVGFPSDDFNQESGDQAKTAQVCYIDYGVKFTMLAPQPVTGAAANPVFRELARQSREPNWNFNKYLVTPAGKVSAAFGSEVTPEAPELAAAIEALLKASATPP